MKFLYAFFCLCASAHAALPITHFTTTQGTPVVFYQAMEVPILDIGVAFYAGSAYDGSNFGLSMLTTELIDQGNAHKTAETIAKQFAEVGSQFNTETERDYVVLQVRTLNHQKALSQTTHTLSEVIGKPDFPGMSIEQRKNQQLLRIRQNEESGDNIADRAFYETLYHKHPYSHPIDGTVETVKKITAKDIKSFYQKFFVAQNAVIVLVGAIDSAQAHRIAEEISGSLPKGNHASPLPKPNALPEEVNIEIPLPTTQTVFRMGQLGISANDKDYFPLLIGNHILGGGNLISKFAIELREKRGLTYGIYSKFTPLLAEGPFIIGFSTQKTQAHTAETLARQTLQDFIEKGPSEKELESAKQYLVGSFPLSIASNQNLLQILLKISLLKLPENYLDTYVDQVKMVQISDIQQAFKRHVQPQKLLNVQVGRT